MKGLPRSLRRGSAQLAPVRKQTIIVKNLPITVDGVSGVGFGTVVAGDIPEGNFLLLGAIAYLQFTKVTAAGVLDTFDGNFSVGSAPTADNALTGAEVDLIPSTVSSAATAGVSPLTRAVQPAQAILDNTDGTLEVNINFLISDASISANGQILRVDGTIQLLYSTMLDD